MAVKSKEYSDGFAAGLIFAMDTFESRSNAIYSRKWLRRKDIKLVVAILDAIFRSRDKEKKKHDNSPGTDSGAPDELRS